MISNFALLILLACAFIALIAHFMGRNRGFKMGLAHDRKNKEKLEKELRIYKSRSDRLENQVNLLNRKLTKHLNFVVGIPDAVKNVNSHLSFDDILSSTIRLVKELISTEEVEIYMFDEKNNTMNLIAALGTYRGKGIKINVGDGVVGSAAETRMIFTKEQLEVKENEFVDDKIDSATPILFKNELIGVLAIGKIRNPAENDKRFLSMIGDLAGVAFKNCESLGTAKEAAIRDSLTGMYNKLYFFESAREFKKKAMDYEITFSIFIFDIDNFKHYNDTNGHQQGDLLLKELSELLKENTRSTNIIARYGGEEFIVLLQKTDKRGAMVYAEEIRKKIESHPFPHCEKQPLGFVSVSGGVAEFPADGDTVDGLVKHADDALYESKKSGRNRITEYQASQLSENQPIP
jgi:diguanylate cyclase (GGDEF)-like protein